MEDVGFSRTTCQIHKENNIVDCPSMQSFFFFDTIPFINKISIYNKCFL